MTTSGDFWTLARRRMAAQAWQAGGCLALGLWLSKARPHFTVKDYATAVEVARDELGDDTDYAARTQRGAGEGHQP